MGGHRILNPQTDACAASGRCALGIMTKAPEAGKVKTRLSPPLTPEEAAEINRCFLRDIAREITFACKETPAVGVAVYTPLGAEKAYAHILPHEFYLLPQRGTDFGQRLVLAVEDLIGAGFKSVCLINSDSPTVPAAAFVEAVRALEKPGDRVVLGPSEDGGYYLIGVKNLHARLFERIDWSTGRVLAQTIERAAEIGVPIQPLPNGYDVDDQATLHRLCDELLRSQAKATEKVAPNTRNFLRGIIEREGRARIWPV